VEKLNFQVERLTQIYGMPPRTARLLPTTNLSDLTNNNNSSTLIQAQIDAQSLEVHQKIIEEILGTKNPYVQAVIILHQKHYLNFLNSEHKRARIRLLRLQFSNLYCYGLDNVIDFTKLENSLSGAIAPNRAGKSSLIDIITFALYDKYPRAEQKLNIINNQSSQYYLSLDFELDGKQGHIEKKGSKKRNVHSAQYRLIYDNRELTQGTNTLTCQEIEKLVGTYSNAQLTSIFHQDSGTDFVRLNSNERKRTLAQLLALGSFEKIEKEAYEEYLELRGKLNSLQDNFQGKEAVELIQEREVAININNESKTKIKKLEQELELKERD
jgi:DNA repair exonuclease SbcCD ATPase subunit